VEAGQHGGATAAGDQVCARLEGAAAAELLGVPPVEETQIAEKHFQKQP